MKYYLIALAALIITIACNRNNIQQSEAINNELQTFQNITPSNESSVIEKPSGSLYRCDGFYNGIASEWVQVAFNDDDNKLRKMWYWNTSDTIPKELDVLSIKYLTGEIGSIHGKVRFKQINDTLEFGMVEDRFHFLDANDVFHEFDMESQSN